MKEYYFKISSLAVGYEKTPLIEDINISLKQGEIMTLIGPNGSGKSTILKSISRHIEALYGDVTIGDESIFGISYGDLSKKLSVLLTERVKGDLMTCFDIAATGRYPYTGKLGILSAYDRDKVNEALRIVDAEFLADKDFTAISDGQRQRVLLARAICQEPEIMILDEPTSYLDIRYKLELLSILRRMAKEKDITVIMSLHEIDLAQKISDKVMCVKGDRIEHFGSPEEIFTSEIIQELYDLDGDSYNIMFGSIELPRVGGTPKVFVISAAGSGIPVYRLLQRRGIPFAAGILFTNDIDYVLAKDLASEVVCEPPFSRIGDASMERAKALIGSCEEVINCGFPEGENTKELAELVSFAKEKQKLTNKF